MKLLNLQLLRFGCFTNVPLDFSEPGRSFCVIYGSNEAGKSTVLRALTGLLYGIPFKTTDAFLHDMKDLRVAAEIERTDGKRLKFTRRKGNRDTILDPDDRPIPDALLLEFLGGATEEIFTTTFRLDHASLVRGREDLLAGKGDLAESLFQAGTGISGLHQVLAALEAEAEQLFKPRSNTALINRELDAYEEARKRSRDLSIPPKQWARQSDALKAKEEELKDLKAHISDLSGSKEQLTRFRLALPHVTRRKGLLSETDTLGPVTLLPESATREREEAERRRHDATSAREKAEGKLARLHGNIGQLPLAEDIVAQAEAITNAYGRLHSYQQAIHDLPTVSAEQLQFEADARALLSEIKPGLALEQAGTLRLTVVQRTRIQNLAKRNPTLQERLRSAKKHAESIHGDWQKQKQLLGQMPSQPDTNELERAIELARKEGDLEAGLRAEDTLLRTTEEQVAAELKRMTLWSGALERLESLPVPSLETVEHFNAELNTLGNEQKLLEVQRDENRQRATKLEGEIQALRLGGAVPTEAELQQARECRERGWRLVRRAWLEGVSDSAQEKAFDPERPLAEAYERSVADADTIADRLRREADRVARLAGLLVDEEDCKQRAQELERQQASLTANLDACQQRWREAWQPAAIVPLSPKEMRAWLTQYAAMVTQACEIHKRRHTVEQLQQRITVHAGELNEALNALGEPMRGESETLSALLHRSQTCLQRRRESAQERTKVENEARRLAVEYEKATRERDNARGDLQVWLGEWQQAIAPLGLPSETRDEEASAVLEKLDALFKNLGDAENHRSRVEAMQKHIAQFNSDILALVQLLATSLHELPSDQAATQLHSLLTKAREDEARRQTFEKQIKDEETALANAESDFSKAESQLRALLERAQCTDLASLEEAEHKSARVQQLTGQRAEVDKTLTDFTAGATLDGFLTAIGKADVDKLPFQITELNKEIQSLDDQRSKLEQDVGRERAALQAMDGNDQASAAAEEAQSALSAVRVHTDHYLRLRLASEVLRRHIEHYREQNQDPVIKRASEIFPHLTLGSFARLKTGFDEKNRPVLLGVRPSGEELDVAGMSDGTRDQLFLALRIASLEQQLIAGEPLPFIVDDVLVNFDDGRAQATLKQLAEVARRTQVLFFTHHTRLLELAKKAVPNELLKAHVLGTT
jgi:uncharacterized protein YhaN